MELKKLSNQIKELEDKITELKSIQEALKRDLIKEIESNGATTYKDDNWYVYKVEDSEFVKFDEKAFQVADFQLYNKLMGLYNKKVTKKGNYTWKKNV